MPNLRRYGRQQDRDEHVAAGPAEHVAEAVVAEHVERARHADERGRAHPVGARGHAVVDRRHAPPCHVVLGDLGGPRDDADHRVDRDREADEHVADRPVRHAHLLEDRHQDDETDEAPGVDPVDLAEVLDEPASGRHGVFSLFLVDAALFVDPVLAIGEPEEQDDEGDQRSLCGHIEAEREAEDDDLVERRDEEMDDEAEEEPERQQLSTSARACGANAPRRGDR